MATTRLMPLAARKGRMVDGESFVSGEITPEEANRLGRELAKRFTRSNPAYIVCSDWHTIWKK